MYANCRRYTARIAGPFSNSVLTPVRSVGCGAIKPVGHFLRARVIFGDSYVDEEPRLLDRPHPPRQQDGKNILLETRRSIGNQGKKLTVKDINPSVHKPHFLLHRLLEECSYQAVFKRLNRAISSLVSDARHRQREQDPGLAMDLEQMPEVGLHKGIAIGHEEMIQVLEQGSCVLNSPGGTKRGILS